MHPARIDDEGRGWAKGVSATRRMDRYHTALFFIHVQRTGRAAVSAGGKLQVAFRITSNPLFLGVQAVLVIVIPRLSRHAYRNPVQPYRLLPWIELLVKVVHFISLLRRRYHVSAAVKCNFAHDSCSAPPTFKATCSHPENRPVDNPNFYLYLDAVTCDSIAANSSEKHVSDSEGIPLRPLQLWRIGTSFLPPYQSTPVGPCLRYAGGRSRESSPPPPLP